MNWWSIYLKDKWERHRESRDWESCGQLMTIRDRLAKNLYGTQRVPTTLPKNDRLPAGAKASMGSLDCTLGSQKYPFPFSHFRIQCWKILILWRAKVGFQATESFDLGLKLEYHSSASRGRMRRDISPTDRSIQGFQPRELLSSTVNTWMICWQHYRL